VLSAANRRWPRGLGLVSQILLAVQVISLGHLLAVRHVTCPEHGDIIHVSPSPAFVVAALPPGGGPDRATVAAAVVDSGDHEHCQACVDHGRRAVLPPPAACDLRLAGVPTARACPTETDPYAALDLILLSPKNSPPTA
jgi:hypothetical protein